MMHRGDGKKNANSAARSLHPAVTLVGIKIKYARIVLF